MKQIFSPQELGEELGEGLRALRLQKNLDQKTLGEMAGVSVSALKHLESGQGATVNTLVRVARTLGRQDWIRGIAPQVTINPLHMVKGPAPRQRARRRRLKAQLKQGDVK